MDADQQTAGDLPLTSVLERFAEQGFRGSLTTRPGGTVACGSCDNVVRPGDLDVQAQHRLEGASDPSDSLLVVGVGCPRCGQRGALVLGFGPMASERDADVVVDLPVGRDLPDPVAQESQ